MANWYDDDSFWETFRDYMFNPARLEQTRAEVDQLITLLKLGSGVHVLDLCCGIGRHSLEFARRGFMVTGLTVPLAISNRRVRAPRGKT